jgi:hypothetical protein
MRIGPVDRKPVDLPQHLLGENAVQVERDDHRLAGRERAGLLQQPALRIELAVRPHGAVQREIDRVDMVDVGADRIHDLGRKPLPARGRQQPGAARARADRRNDRYVAARLEHRERTPDCLVFAALLVQRVAATDVKVLVLRRQRIERGNLLHAFDDENSGH